MPKAAAVDSLVGVLDREFDAVEAKSTPNWDSAQVVLARGISSSLATLSSGDEDLARPFAYKVLINCCGLEALRQDTAQNGAVLDQLIVGMRSRDIQWGLIHLLVTEQEQWIDAGRLAAALTCTSGSEATNDRPLASLPFPCLLTTQDLVELLKMPNIFGETRQVVLAALGNRYSRRFTNHWQFVRFAKERKLDLDFTTPPKRPDPAKSREAIIKALKGEPIPG